MNCGDERTSLIKRLNGNPTEGRPSCGCGDCGIKLFRALADSFKGDL
jgi:hypothetical protein